MRWLLLCLLLAGCDGYVNGRPTLQQGESKEEQTIKQKQNTATKVTVETTPSEKPGPVTVMDFFGQKMSVPTNSKVKVEVESDYSSKQTDWYSLVGQFNYKSGMGQLIFIGTLCIAGGAVLCYFGMWSVGIGLAIFGFLLIACGITIEKYPWIFVCVLLMGLIAVVAFVIYTIKNKNLGAVKTDLETTLTEVCDKIETLKKIDPAAVKTHITDALAKSYNNQVIAKVTKKVRKKE